MVVIAGLPPQSWNRGRLAVHSVGGRVGSVVQVLHLNDGQYFVSAKMCSQWPSNSQSTNLSRTHTCTLTGRQMRGFIELFVACNSKEKTIPDLRLETVLRFLIWTLSRLAVRACAVGALMLGMRSSPPACGPQVGNMQRAIRCIFNLGYFQLCVVLPGCNPIQVEEHLSSVLGKPTTLLIEDWA